MYNLVYLNQTAKYEFDLDDKHFYRNKIHSSKMQIREHSSTTTQKIIPSKVRHVQLTDKYITDTQALIAFGLGADEVLYG